jgi:signal transduction histidine kinase
VPKGFEEGVAAASSDGDRYLLPRATAVYAESGAITGATVVLQDVTRLRRVDELRNDLVATVAHEFRTPLTSLRMAIHLCLEQTAGPLSAKQADLLYAAREDCERLQLMVDELLDLARIQGGRIELHRRPTAPSLLVDAAVDAYRKLADEQQVLLQSAVNPGLRDVLADRERAQLVLSNLLSNALRHTPTGGSIDVRAVPVDGAVRFAVADTGEGIPPEYRRRIFDKFVRVPESASGGAGLGLAIAKDIVDAHGGEIGADETPGGGATVWFTLPTVSTVKAASAIRARS